MSCVVKSYPHQQVDLILIRFVTITSIQGFYMKRERGNLEIDSNYIVKFILHKLVESESTKKMTK